MKKNNSKWEQAILDVLKRHNGIANLSILYDEVPKLINETTANDIKHTIRAFLGRLKDDKKLIIQTEKSVYKLANFKENIENNNRKHENYEILNLIGYGLSKFNEDFIKEFGFKTKTAFYEYCVKIDIAETVGVVKNRMDLFDHFFPNNGRKGWWQKGDAYIHRKYLIDSLFGNENAKSYVNIVKLYLKENYKIKELFVDVTPIIKSRFKKLQETGLEAELYFMNNFNSIEIFKNGILEDARLFGDGYDFQINVNESIYLAEIKGIRANKGRFRMTENEYKKALEYKNDYLITLVLNMNDLPTFLTIENPANNLKFKKEERAAKPIIEYHLISDIC